MRGLKINGEIPCTGSSTLSSHVFLPRIFLAPLKRCFLSSSRLLGYLDVSILQKQRSLDCQVLLSASSFQDWSLLYYGRVPGDPPFWKTQAREEGQSPEYFIFIPAVAMPVAMKSRPRGWQMSSPYFSHPSPSHRGRGAQPWTICMAGRGALRGQQPRAVEQLPLPGFE